MLNIVVSIFYITSPFPKLWICVFAWSADLPTYITRFQWDMAKYPIKQSLRNIADIISKQVGQIDADLKTKATGYNNLKGNLQNLEKKQTYVESYSLGMFK